MKPRQGGFALIVVLWTMVLLAGLVTWFATTGRIEVGLARNLRRAALLQAAADSAVHEAAFRLLQGAWRPGARAHAISAGPIGVSVTVRDERSKLDPNSAQPPQLLQTLVAIGMPATLARSVTRAIMEWRSRLTPVAARAALAAYLDAGLPYGPPGEPFDTAAEVGLVLGMTPHWLALLEPMMSVHGEGDGSAGAAPLFETVTTDPDAGSWQFGGTGRFMVVTVEAIARDDIGGCFARRTALRLRGERHGGRQPMQVLTWETTACD